LSSYVVLAKAGTMVCGWCNVGYIARRVTARVFGSSPCHKPFYNGRERFRRRLKDVFVG